MSAWGRRLAKLDDALLPQTNQACSAASGEPASAAEAVGNTASGVDPVLEAAAMNAANGVNASAGVGRPLASNTAVFDPTYWPGVQSPNVYVWRTGQLAASSILETAGRTLGAVGTVIDLASGIQNVQAGNNLQAASDFASSAAGAAMLVSFSATAPYALPALMMAKLMPSYTQFNSYWLCMGAPMSNY